MASIDDELLLDAQEDAREAEYIFNQLSSELKERFNTDEIIMLMNLIVDYCFDSGILDGDDEVEIDLEQVADAVCQKAKANGAGTYDPADVFFIVQADLDYQEQSLD